MQYTAVFSLLLYKYVFTASAVLLKFTVLCIGIFIGIFPEALYFLLASYRYFMENFDSVMFLRPCGSPDSGFNARICFFSPQIMTKNPEQFQNVSGNGPDFDEKSGILP